jgi:hypothetical protein
MFSHGVSDHFLEAPRLPLRLPREVAGDCLKRIDSYVRFVAYL